MHSLKTASYEGRIGLNAFIYDPDQCEPRLLLFRENQFLTFPANSIVFVESETYFRLPSFIAVRFNLQIRHVHRGLLLGTGPLVDPGFWGRLCIPIHNLTDEDYTVPCDEGLIWIEFTKTTSAPLLGEPPSNSNLDDIKDAISKSSQPYSAVVKDLKTQFNGSKRIGVRSSIASKFREAQETARQAKEAAKGAQASVKQLSILGFFGLIFGSFIFFDLWVSFRDALVSSENSIRALSERALDETSQNSANISDLRLHIETLQQTVDEQTEEISHLRPQLDLDPDDK